MPILAKCTCLSFDTAIDFTRLKAVGESVDEPRLYYHTNIGFALNLYTFQLHHIVAVRPNLTLQVNSSTIIYR